MKIPLPIAKRRARIEIIPLIDIVFFLLATFVMVSLSMIKNQGIAVHLPQAATGSPQDQKDQVTITVDKNGAIYLNKEQVSFEQMSVQLKHMNAAQPDLRILINGDDQASFGKAVAVLDEVRRLGISKVAIQTQNKTSISP